VHQFPPPSIFIDKTLKNFYRSPALDAAGHELLNSGMKIDSAA
jgi:hypothetical protein